MTGDLSDVEASCAICGAPPSIPECPHEGERLELALNQAFDRWIEKQRLKDWVLHHARNQVITTFRELKAMRLAAHQHYLQTLPCYTLYQRWNGNPPLQAAQLQLIHSQIAHANTILQQGVDEDWRTSCMQYPQVLDYFFSLVDVDIPSDTDPAVVTPRFGGPPPKEATAPRRVKQRRDSVGLRETPPPPPPPPSKELSRKPDKRRRGTGRTPPPAPEPGNWRR